MAANIDAAMLDMFRAEVETHLAALNDGLLALEKQPRRSELFEPMMRAAHSIKGAAKIVGLPAAVQVAHAIEDCFVAVRERRVEMTSELVDVLLASVDLLARAADVDDAGQVTLDVDDARIRRAVAGIADAMRGEVQAGKPRMLKAPADLTGDWFGEHRDQILSAAAPLDMSEVETIDAAALGFLALAMRPRDRSSGLTLRGARANVDTFLHAVGLQSACSAGPGN